MVNSVEADKPYKIVAKKISGFPADAEAAGREVAIAEGLSDSHPSRLGEHATIGGPNSAPASFTVEELKQWRLSFPSENLQDRTE